MDICTTSCLFGGITQNWRLVLWSYETKKCFLNQQLDQEAYCLSLHVSGHMVLIGMRDKLRRFHILFDRLELVQEYPVKRTQVAKISAGGHLVATVCRANTIHVYEVYKDSKEPWKVLKGHVSVVTDLCWTDHDQNIISVSAGGACYTWTVATGQRIAAREYVDKGCVYHRVLPAQDGSYLAYMTSGNLQWIRNGRLMREFEVSSGSTNAPIDLTCEWETLLYGTDEGTIVSQSLTIDGGGDVPTDDVDVFPLHHQEVALLRIAKDASFVVTCDVKGVIILSRLQQVSDGVLTECPHKSKDLAHHYVLLTVEEVVAKAAKEWELQCLILSEKKNAEYTIMKETQSLRDAVNTYRTENEGLRKENLKQTRTLQESRRLEETKLRAAIAEMEEKHRSEVEKLESLYRKRLDAEASKLRRLEEMKDDAVFSVEEKMIQLQKQNANETENLRQFYEGQLGEEKRRYSKLEEDKQTAEREAEEVVRQLEIDNDQHVETLQEAHLESQKLNKEDERRMKVENNIMARGILKLKSEKIDDMRKMRELQKEVSGSAERLQQQTEIANKLNHEVAERDYVISSNYQTIQELRREVQELEKHKYVLGYQAEKYKEEIYPTAERISKLEKDLKLADDRRAKSVDAVCRLKTRLRDKTLHVTALQKEMAVIGTKRQQAMSDDPAENRDRAADNTRKMLAQVERRNRQLQKNLESKEKASRAALRRKTTENRVLLEEIADLKRQKGDLTTQLDQLRTLSASPSVRRAVSAATHRRPTVTVQRAPVTRPGSMRPYEWGAVTTTRPRTASASRRRRPHSAATPL